MRVALANVTSLRLHWHTVADWRADVVLITETRLTAVAQRVMRAQAGASGWQAFWGAPLESRGGGIWDAPAGGVGILVRQGIPAKQLLPPKGAPRTESDALAQTLLHCTRWCHVVVGLGRGADTLHAQVAYGVSAQPALNRTFWDPATRYVARHGMAPQLVGGDFNFDLNYPLRVPPSILASLLTRRLADADLGLATALGRDPLCSYRGPQGTRPSRIDGLLVDTRLAPLHAAERLPQGVISGHTPVCFYVQLKGASQRVVKFFRPKPLVPAQRKEQERLLLVQRLLDPMEAGWQAALATGDMDHDRGGDSPRPGLPGYHSGHPPGRGHPSAGPSTPPPRQGHGPTASGGAPLPPAAARHGRAPDLPGGTRRGGPGTPPGGPALVGAPSAGAGRPAASGAAGVDGPAAPPGQTPRARPGVCGL